MPAFRPLLFTGLMCALSLTGASAQTTRPGQSQIISPWLGNLMRNQVGQADPTTVDPTTYISLRAGAMVSPRGAGVVGLDFALPSLSIGPNWHGRVDLDVIISASLANTNTAVPITLDQIYYRPQTGNTDVYAGFGVGAILGGNTNFVGKLILGSTFTRRFGAEVNINFTENDTLVLLLGRVRL